MTSPFAAADVGRIVLHVLASFGAAALAVLALGALLRPRRRRRR